MLKRKEFLIIGWLDDLNLFGTSRKEVGDFCLVWVFMRFTTLLKKIWTFDDMFELDWEISVFRLVVFSILKVWKTGSTFTILEWAFLRFFIIFLWSSLSAFSGARLRGRRIRIRTVRWFRRRFSAFSAIFRSPPFFFSMPFFALRFLSSARFLFFFWYVYCCLRLATR